MRGLYAIVDVDFLDARGIPVLAFAEAVLAGAPAVLQLRAKRLSSRDTLSMLRALRERTAAAGVPLFANDRPDLAILAGCDGVHVGQEDPSPEDVRRLSPALRVGVSTHTLPELDAALRARPDYVAFGPVFRTTSKARPDPTVGAPGLAAAHALARAAGVPLVAIGGITLERAGAVAPHAELLAVVSALLPEEGQGGVARRTRALGDASLPR